VNEHPELGIPPPSHAGIAFGLGFGGGRRHSGNGAEEGEEEE
jgi:hypothetical protein